VLGSEEKRRTLLGRDLRSRPTMVGHLNSGSWAVFDRGRDAERLIGLEPAVPGWVHSFSRQVASNPHRPSEESFERIPPGADKTDQGTATPPVPGPFEDPALQDAIRTPCKPPGGPPPRRPGPRRGSHAAAQGQEGTPIHALDGMGAS